MTPHLILVGADKGGVGKTFVSRALLEYLPAGARVVDTETRADNLSRFYPDATRIDAAKIDDQMRLFDAMPTRTVVDIRAGLLSPTLRSMRELGLLEDVEKGALLLDVVHVLGHNTASLEEIADVQGALTEGGTHTLVKNYADASAQFFGFDPEKVTRYFGKMPTIEFPHLEARANEEVEARAQLFSAFVADEKNSLVLRRRVKYWTGLVRAEFDRVKLAKTP